MRVVIPIILMLILHGCQDKVHMEKPEGLIGKSEMADLIYDMHLAIGTSNIQNIYLEKNRNYMALVFEKYGVDSTRFAISNLYYTSEIKEYEEIFEEVYLRLGKERDFYQAKMDSILTSKNEGYDLSRYKDSISKTKNLSQYDTEED